MHKTNHLDLRPICSFLTHLRPLLSIDTDCNYIARSGFFTFKNSLFAASSTNPASENRITENNDLALASKKFVLVD